MRHEENFVHSYPFAGEKTSLEDTANKEPSNDTSSSLWAVVTSVLARELDGQFFDAYIKPLAPLSVDLDRCEFTLASPSKFIVEKIERTYSERIAAILKEQVGEPVFKVVFKIDPTLFNVKMPASSVDQKIVDQKIVAQKIVVKKPTCPTSPIKTKPEMSGPDFSGLSKTTPGLISNLNPKYTFSNFVVGNSNQFCHAAARQVSEEPGQSYNPLFIYGGVGLGKTHLLHAIGNAALEKNPSARVIYMSSETFTNELIQSLRCGKMEDFKEKLRGLDVLLIDDIQFISGKERTQEEFFHTFNTLYGAKKQIVVTCDSIPQDVTGLKERLQTRFSWGLIADLQAPDFETRVAILNRKAAIDGLVLPMDVAQYIADNISTNVRELEGALTRLGAISSLQGIAISLALTESVLRPMLKSKVVNISVDDIKKVVSSHFNLKVSDLSSKKRSRSYSFPRHIAMYLCRKHTTCSYPDIGREFGGRDHSSVIHAANVVSKKLKVEIEVRALVDKIDGLLRSA